MEFYRCKDDNQLFIRLIDKKNTIAHCDGTLEKLLENTIIEENDIHFPTIRKVGSFVTVSLKKHPNIDVHQIEFICMETNQGYHYKECNINTTLEQHFVLAKQEKIVKIYVYCNIHSLWSIAYSNNQ